MSRRMARVLAAVMAVLVCSAVARADLLWDDPNAMAAWKGFQDFSSSVGGYTLNVRVGYAVYLPGQYELSGGDDPSGGTECVYAYQVMNTINPASVEVSALTVGVVAGSGAHNIGTDTSAGAPGVTGDVSPSSSSIGTTSARWFFLADTVDYGEKSVLLLFTSPNLPQWMSSSVADGGLSDRQDMPSPSLNPVPEPTTMAFLALGGVALFAGYGYRRRARRQG